MGLKGVPQSNGPRGAGLASLLQPPTWAVLPDGRWGAPDARRPPLPDEEALIDHRRLGGPGR
eukprot:9539586-Alexandrium_andersonii.AAC.1